MLRRRWIILLSVAAILLVGAEVTFRQWEAPKTCVQIINQGDGTMEDLVVDYAGSKLMVGRLAEGQSTHVWLTAGPKGPLRLEFRQKRNPMAGFEVADFDPVQCLRDGFKLVLLVKTNEVQRFMDDDEFRKNQESLGDRIQRWIRSEIEPTR